MARHSTASQFRIAWAVDRGRAALAGQQRPAAQHARLPHHTRRGTLTLADDGLLDGTTAGTGARSSCSAGASTDPDEEVRRSIAGSKAGPAVPHRDVVWSSGYDVGVARLCEVTP